MAAPASQAVLRVAVNAKIDGPDPDKLQPSAPARIAATFTS